MLNNAVCHPSPAMQSLAPPGPVCAMEPPCQQGPHAGRAPRATELVQMEHFAKLIRTHKQAPAPLGAQIPHVWTPACILTTSAFIPRLRLRSRTVSAALTSTLA